MGIGMGMGDGDAGCTWTAVQVATIINMKICEDGAGQLRKCLLFLAASF